MKYTVNHSIQDGLNVIHNINPTIIIDESSTAILIPNVLTVNLVVGWNTIPHTLARKISFLSAFYNKTLRNLAWSPYDPISGDLSTTNVYVYSGAILNDVILNIQ